MAEHFHTGHVGAHQLARKFKTYLPEVFRVSMTYAVKEATENVTYRNSVALKEEILMREIMFVCFIAIIISKSCYGYFLSRVM